MFKIFKKTMKISQLFDYYTMGKLNMSPYYQRSGTVWSGSKKQNLIDSILNEIDLPKFYFHFYPAEDEGKYDYAVIDGKQRILAIMAFLNGDVKLKKDFCFLDDKYKDIEIGGMCFDDIQEEYPYVAARFLMFEIDIVFVDTDNVDRINEMFIRINAGVPVNNAEKRNALGGKLMKMIGQICVEHPFFRETVCFADNRNVYQEILLKLFVLEYKREIVTLSNATIENVLGECKNCDNNEKEILQQVIWVLHRMHDIFQKKCKLLKTNNIVTYYWFLKDKHAERQELFDFVENFECNRSKVKDEPNENLVDYLTYNELVRQGTYQKTSIEKRLLILEKLYKKW